MKRRQLLKMLAVAPLIPLAAKLAPAVDYFGHGIPEEMVIRFANPTLFTVGDVIVLDSLTGRLYANDQDARQWEIAHAGEARRHFKGSFKITKIERGTVTIE